MTPSTVAPPAAFPVTRIRGRAAVDWLRPARLDPLPVFRRMRAELGEVILFSVPRRDFLITFRPEDVEFLLVPGATKTVKGHALQRSRRLFGDGLLTSEGELHKRQRRLAQPAFQPRHLDPYAEPMVRHSQRAVETLLAGRSDLERVTSTLTLDVAAETMFGTTLDAEERTRLASAMDVVRDQFGESLHPLAPLYDHLPIARTRRARRAVRDIDSVVDRIIRERREAPDLADRGDLLSLFMAARDSAAGGDGKGMSEALLRDESVTLLLAGHETTANALAWALWLLATHPEELALVRAELDERCGGRLPGIEDVGQLPHLRRVIAETLRLYPPGPALARRTTEALTLPSGVRVEAGCEIVLPIHMIHRDPDWFPDAEVFRPSRFAAGMPPSGWPRHVWVPFGGGRRVCIGQAFAMMEMELVLAVVLGAVDLHVEPDQHVRPKAAFTLSPESGIFVTATPRVP